MFNFLNRSFYFVIPLIFGFIILSANEAFAQPKDNSPHSRLGLGDPFDQFFAAQSGMAGMGAAYHDFYHINIQNPASYSHLNRAAFEVGMFSKYGVITENSSGNTNEAWSGNLSYLSLGFPLQNRINEVLEQKSPKVRWGMNFTLLPFTNVGYNIATSEDIAYADTITTVNYLFRGTGGTYKILWGNSFKVKNFSAGLNLGYIFGKIENEKQVRFPDLVPVYDNLFQDDYKVNGFIWNLGVQYDHVLKENDAGTPTKYITVGLTGNSKNSYNLTRTRNWVTLNQAYGDVDTIPSVTGVDVIESKSFLPSEIGFGVMYVNENKSRLGFDFKRQVWNKFLNNVGDVDASNNNDQSAFRIAVGGELTPDENSYNNYFRRVRYRFGGYYSSDPRTINDEQLLKYGVTFGMGMPIILPRQGKSFINLGFEVGKQGFADSLQETFFKFNLGFTLNDDTWFFKRKFN